MLGPRTDEKHLPVAGTGAGSELTPLAVRSPLDRHDHLRARADMRGELVPAAHGAELWGSDGVRAVELVDRRVDPPRRPFRFAGRGLRHLTRGYIAPAAPYSRASLHFRQVNRVVPLIPFALDRGFDLGNDNQPALGQVGHCALLAEWLLGHHDPPTMALRGLGHPTSPPTVARRRGMRASRVRRNWSIFAS